MNLLLRFFPLLLPLAVKWAERAEKRILLEGVPLVEPHLSDAKMMGVEYPEKIRLLKVPRIPLPNNPIVKFAAHFTGLVSAVCILYPRGFFKRPQSHRARVRSHEPV